MRGRRGKRRKKLLDDHKEKRRYWKLKDEALDRTLWRTSFGRGYGPVVGASPRNVVLKPVDAADRPRRLYRKMFLSDLTK